MLLNALFFFGFITNSYSLERIWLIRHCDKPTNLFNPCCSDIGYQRAKTWHKYFDKYLNTNKKIQIYSSNYNENKICFVNKINYTPNNNCQKSQRMFLTAYYLQEKLKEKYNINDNINLDYCVGDKNKVIYKILQNDYITDVIIVWEHTEIIEIIRHFDIKIKKWRNKHIDEYNIVFLIDIATKQLYYDCFDFITNNAICSNKVYKWLHNFQNINLYYNMNYYSSSAHIFNAKQSVYYFYRISLVSLFIVSFIFWFIKIIILCNNFKNRRKYIEII